MKKRVRLLAFLLVLLLFCSSTFSVSSMALIIPGRHGDADGDWHITTTDARMVLQYCVGKTSLRTDTNDVDGDGELTTTDARLILQAAVGKRNYSAVGEWHTWVYPEEREFYLKTPKMSWGTIRDEGVPNPVTGQLP